MLTFLIDTAGLEGGVLLARNDDAACAPGKTVILGDSVLEPREFSRQLIAAILKQLRENQLAIRDLDMFAVISGPGSFTGLRVGLSAVKALAEATARPAVGISRLAVVASAATEHLKLTDTQAPVHAVLDAGRGEFYHGIYRDAGRMCVLETVDTPAELVASLEKIPGPIAIAEPTLAEALQSHLNAAPCLLPNFSVHAALPLALTAWKTQQFQEVAELDANYLRRMTPRTIVSAEELADPVKSAPSPQ